MSLISQNIAHLIGGLSQRPALHRRAEQLATADNVLADARYGLMKRPALDYQQKLTATITQWSTAFIHPIERDANERQRLVILPHATTADLKVYDVVSGAELTVRDRTGGFAYLDGTSVASDYRARTVGDTTFIVNRTQTPAMSTTGRSAVTKYEAIVSVTRGDFDTPYVIYLNDAPAIYITPSASTAIAELEITTTEIARQLIREMRANLLTNTFYSFTQFKSAIHIQRRFPSPGTRDFRIKVNDGLGGEGLSLAKEEVQSVEDLPRFAKNAMVLKVANSPDSDKDDFYVRYRGDNSPEDGGVWVEAPSPGRLTRFDRSTMPHQLVRKGNWVLDTVAEQYVQNEPLISQHGDDTTNNLAWDEDLTGAGISDKDIVIRDHADGRQKDINGTGVEQRIEVAYDIDTSLMDPGADVDVVLYHWDDSDETELLRRTYTPGKTKLQELMVVTTNTFTTGGAPDDKLRIKLEYQQDTPPTVVSTQATLTLQSSTTPIKADPLLDTSDYLRPTYRYRASIRVTEYRATEIEYRLNDQLGDAIVYPTGLACTIKLNSTHEFTHTNVAGEGAVEIATAMAALITAHGTYTATNPSDRKVKVTLSAGGTAVQVDSDTQMTDVIFYSSELSLVTNELAGKELINRSDGSTGTVQSNTATTIVVDAMAGGSADVIAPGDVCYVNEAGTYFIFQEVPYAHCRAGDLVTNDEPSFIGEPILDVFFYENRLGFTAGESIMFSESGQLFNFWRTATSQLLDSDRVDVKSAHAEVSVLHSVVQWNSKLYGWAENVQFEISGAPAIGPRTIRLDTVSRYINTSKFRPIVAGERLFFMHGKGTSVQVQEYLPPSEDMPDSVSARDLTLEIPSLIAGNVLDAVSDASLGLLAVLADGDQEKVYVYSWATDKRGGEPKIVHEAWQTWIVPAGSSVLGMEFTRGNLGLILERPDGIFYVDMDLDINVTPGAAERADYMDFLLTQADTSPSYSGGTGTTWTIPYEVNVDQATEGELVVWRTDTFAQVAVIRPSTTTVRTATDVDLSSVNVNVGIAYTMTATLTPLYRRGPEGRPIRTGRLQLRAVEVNYHDTTDFDIVTTLPGTSRAYTTSLSAATPRDGTLRHSALGRAEEMTITLQQASAGGARFSSVDWEGFSHNRARRG